MWYLFNNARDGRLAFCATSFSSAASMQAGERGPTACCKPATEAAKGKTGAMDSDIMTYFIKKQPVIQAYSVAFGVVEQ